MKFNPKVAEPNPFEHLLMPQELDSSDIEIFDEEVTDKIELMPQYATMIEQEVRKAVISGLGAAIDAARINGFTAAQCGIIMATAIQILKDRKIVDLKDYSGS